MRGCRMWPTAPSSMGCAPTTSGTAGGSPPGPPWPTAGRSTHSTTTAGIGRWHPATSCPPSWSPRPRRARPALRLGRFQADLGREGYTWTRKTSAADLFKPGDLIDVAIVKIDPATGVATVTLDQTPLRRGRAARHRQPHRPDQGDGRRLELQPQQVQPRGAGLSSARIDLQADCLHRRRRSRLHARRRF